jgi:hypothetical protein
VPFSRRQVFDAAITSLNTIRLWAIDDEARRSVRAQDGPEEKTGEMRFQISAISARLNATLSVAGVVCTYSGRLSDSHDGTMSCPDREAVPLKLWVK